MYIYIYQRGKNVERSRTMQCKGGSERTRWVGVWVGLRFGGLRTPWQWLSTALWVCAWEFEVALWHADLNNTLVRAHLQAQHFGHAKMVFATADLHSGSKSLGNSKCRVSDAENYCEDNFTEVLCHVVKVSKDFCGDPLCKPSLYHSILTDPSVKPNCCHNMPMTMVKVMTLVQPLPNLWHDLRPPWQSPTCGTQFWRTPLPLWRRWQANLCHRTPMEDFDVQETGGYREDVD